MVIVVRIEVLRHAVKPQITQALCIIFGPVENAQKVGDPPCVVHAQVQQLEQRFAKTVLVTNVPVVTGGWKTARVAVVHLMRNVPHQVCSVR